MYAESKGRLFGGCGLGVKLGQVRRKLGNDDATTAVDTQGVSCS